MIYFLKDLIGFCLIDLHKCHKILKTIHDLVIMSVLSPVSIPSAVLYPKTKTLLSLLKVKLSSLWLHVCQYNICCFSFASRNVNGTILSIISFSMRNLSLRNLYNYCVYIRVESQSSLHISVCNLNYKKHFVYVSRFDKVM